MDEFIHIPLMLSERKRYTEPVFLYYIYSFRYFHFFFYDIIKIKKLGPRKYSSL